MKLPFRRKQGGAESNPIIPEMNGPQPDGSVSRAGQWMRIAIATLAAIVVLWLLFLGAGWSWRQLTHHDSSPAQTSTSKDQKGKKPGQDGNGAGSSGAAGQSAANQPPQNSAGSSKSQGNGGSQPSSGSVQPSPRLTNTGPGSAAALFASVTLGGAVLYQIALRRKTE